MSLQAVLSNIESTPIAGIIFCLAAIIGYKTRQWRWPLFWATIFSVIGLFILFVVPHLITPADHIQMPGLINTVVFCLFAGTTGLCAALGGLLRMVTPSRPQT